jgi:diaminopimelate epimerase
MTQLTLRKYHGNGNDFLVVFDPPEVDLPALARRLCDRHRGIGADGLLVGEPAAGHTARMTVYNADGTRPEMCGNGIRCFAQDMAQRNATLEPQRILTDAGTMVITLDPTEDGAVIEAAVDMGPVAVIAAPANWAELGADPLRPISHLGLGNPHSVVAVGAVAGIDLEALGRIVPTVNLEIVEAGPEADAITMRVHERGVGITEACGTGACASAWAASAWGLVPATTTEILVHMDGGDVRVRLHDPAPGRVTLVGPAQFVGTVTVEV